MSYFMENLEDMSLKPKKQMLWQHESHIWRLKNDVNNDTFKTFTVNDLFSDLFCITKESDPLIILHEVPKKNKDKLNLLLPKSVINQITAYEPTHYLSDKDNNSDYNWPFRATGDNIKFFKVIHFLFSDNNELELISDIQNHLITILTEAQFTNLSNIKKYLKSIGENTIVPEKESSAAHAAFKSLVESNSKESFSLIIANFFISALIGLIPLNDYGKIFYKAYVLNGLGMEYIWTPELITVRHEKMHDLQQLYRNGHLGLCYKQGKEWLEEYLNEASGSELSIVYQLLGLSICIQSREKGNNEFEGNQSEGIEYLRKCIDTGKADVSVFYYLYVYLKEDDKVKSIEYLKTAFAQNYAKAVIEVAYRFLSQDYTNDDITEEVLNKKINVIIDEEQHNTVIDVSECLYLRGRFAKKRGDISNANADFEAASKKGNEKARLEISRKKRMERYLFPRFINDHDAPCCFTNSLSGNNYAALSTFPSNEWVIYALSETDIKCIKTVSSIEEFVDIQEYSGFSHSRLVFLFLSEDGEKNLNECLILLDKLFNVVLDKPDNQRFRIIDAIDIYISAKYETASMLIDANINDMGRDIYFKVHITDENRDAAHKLLCDAPLFIPALDGIKKEKFSKVVLFGDSEMNYVLIKECIACTFLGNKHPIEITLLSQNADLLEKRFHQECPGFFCNDPKISCIRPQFIKCNIIDTDFPAYIYGQTHDQVLESDHNYVGTNDADIVMALLEGNYFVVDYADDLENIRFSAELRTWLLRSRGTFDRAPFIAVKCSSEQSSYLASRLTLSGQASGNSYFNKYDLFPIGISAQTYSFNNIIENPVLNNFALRIHKSYYGGDDRAAENDFYSFSYNADSSLSTAIGLCYRFYAAGVVFRDKDNYLNFGFYNTPNIESKFEERYKDNLEYLSSLEQSRWNGFMLSRGWEPANSSQVQAYKEQSTGFAHKHILAKMHPFIREWGELNDPDLERVLGILKSKFNYNRKPQITTRKSIEDTAKFFTTTTKAKEKSH